MRTNRQRFRAGFTLIEIVVAFAILGLASGVIMSLFGSASTKVMRTENERLAVLSARSAAALIDNEVPLEVGAWQGHMYGKVEWAISIQPYQTEAAIEQSNSSVPPATIPYLVTVHTSVGSGSNQASAAITSLRLKTGAP